MCRFANGSLGLFESTVMRGPEDYNTLELNGDKASVYFDLEDPQRLQSTIMAMWTICMAGARSMSRFEHPYMKNWWFRLHPSARAYLHQRLRRLPARPGDRPTGAATFREGLATQLVMDAILDPRERCLDEVSFPAVV